jgi:Kef-type K+ transport system membrane component KefB
VLVGIVMLVLGFIDEGRRALLIGTGLILGSLGGLELSIREHFAGYRSHSTILAGFCALVVLGALFYLRPRGLEPPARLAIGAVVFAAAFWALARAFKRRAGVSVKVR